MSGVKILALSGDNSLPNWALSGGTLVYRTALSGATGTALGPALVAALISAGWVQTATLSNGVTLKATSPQGNGLIVYLDVLHYSSYVSMQFHNTATGYLHYLGAGAGYVFQIVAGPCQVFISQPNIVGPQSYGSQVCGGIPYIAPTDPAYPDGAQPDECWWSVGDHNGVTPRSALGAVDNGSETSWCGYFHRPGESTAHALVEQGQGMNFAIPIFGFGGEPTTFIYPNLEPVTYEPLVSWGDYCPGGFPYSEYNPKIRGQLWDAFIVSGQQYGAPIAGAEQLIQVYGNGATWINYSYGLPTANLFLLVPSSGGAVGNVAF